MSIFSFSFFVFFCLISCFNYVFVLCPFPFSVFIFVFVLVFTYSLLGKIEEANVHKKKRLAARSEMISLAKALETERDGHKAMGHALQYGLMPKAIEQATVLERVVMMAERSLHSLSRAGGVRLATNLQVREERFRGGSCRLAKRGSGVGVLFDQLAG